MFFIDTELAPFLKAITFHSVQLDEMETLPREKRLLFHKTVQDMVDNGVVKPLCRTIFDRNEVESAIR